jgi:putative Mn2+ efflux pump MntP
MGFLEIFLIGLGLSMDAFAVTLANAASQSRAIGATSSTAVDDGGVKSGLRLRLYKIAPLIFALFQGIMPLIGYFAVVALEALLSSPDFVFSSLIGTSLDLFLRDSGGWQLNLISAILLWLVGGKMLLEAIASIRHPSSESESKNKGIGLGALFAQGLATSLDALVVGVSFATISINIGAAAGIIALTTLICCLLALALGKRFAVILGKHAQLAGGVIIILIGIKALFG